MDREDIALVARILKVTFGVYSLDTAREILKALESSGYHRHDPEHEAPPRTPKIFDASEVTGIL